MYSIKRDDMVKEKSEFKVLLVYPNLSMMLVPPLALSIFTGLLKRDGYIVDLFDSTSYVSEENSSPQNRAKFLQVREFDEEEDMGASYRTDLLGDFRKKVLEFEPDVLLFSVVEDAYSQCLKLLLQIEELDIPTLVGGVFPTASPERCLESPLIKYVSKGEGEICIPLFCEAVRLNKPILNVPNLVYLDDQGKVTKTKLAPLCDLNLSIPDFSLFEEERFIRPMGGKIFKTVPIETYRGCPFSCTYCNSPMQKYFSLEDGLGSFLRRKKIPILRDELKMVDELYSPDFFLFVDDSFLARPKKEIYDFCDMYEEFKKPFWFNTRPENCDPSILKRLNDVGAYRISFGIECGNEQFRMKVLKRNVSNKRLLKHFEDISASGIAFSLNLIIGFPGETRELIMDTIELTRSIKNFDTLTVSIFTPYHGTHLRDIAIQNGWLDPKLITTHTTSNSILNMPPPYLSSDEIDGIMRVLPLYCYFPKSDWDEIKIAESNTAEGNAILEKFSKIYTEEFLCMDQTMKMKMATGSTGCAGDPKNQFLVSEKRLNDEELSTLINRE